MLLEWVEQSAAEPECIEWCDGSEEQDKSSCRRLVESGTFIPLDPAFRPDTFL